MGTAPTKTLQQTRPTAAAQTTLRTARQIKETKQKGAFQLFISIQYSMSLQLAEWLMNHTETEFSTFGHFLPFLTIGVQWLFVRVSLSHNDGHKDVLEPWHCKDTCVLHVWQVSFSYHRGVEWNKPTRQDAKLFKIFSWKLAFTKKKKKQMHFQRYWEYTHFPYQIWL